jgi:localization factor PodJL
MHNLAVLSVIGDMRSANYLTAANWFSKAAEHGLKDSQFNLGVLYERGLGVSRDPARAYRWFALAAKQGDDKAAGKRDLLAAELSAEELSAQGREMTAWTALEIDTEANSKAPEPPVEPAGPRQAAVKPKTPGPQLIKAAWSTQLTTIDEIAAEGQRLLLKLGYSVGQVDGIVGPRTAAAIRAFEQKIGAPATGRLTEALVAKMAFAL